MAYFERIDNKLVCNHPNVVKVHEWDAVALDLNRTSYRLITLTMSNGFDKLFLDYGDGDAQNEAEQWLQSYWMVV